MDKNDKSDEIETMFEDVEKALSKIEKWEEGNEIKAMREYVQDALRVMQWTIKDDRLLGEELRKFLDELPQEGL